MFQEKFHGLNHKLNMNEIRKIAVGPDYKNAMHYEVGQTVIKGHYKIQPLGAEYIKEKDGIIVSSGIEDYKGVNRYGVLVSKPDNDDSELSIGDVCVVHHNCFRTYYNMKGKETKSNEHFRDNLYLIIALLNQWFISKTLNFIFQKKKKSMWDL